MKTCQACKCTETTPCEGGCCWVLKNLCSRCAGKMFGPSGMAVVPVTVIVDLLNAAAGARALCVALVGSRPVSPKAVDALGELTTLSLEAHGEFSRLGSSPSREAIHEQLTDAGVQSWLGDAPEQSDTPRLWRPGMPL